jgi:hypothetical protein
VTQSFFLFSLLVSLSCALLLGGGALPWYCVVAAAVVVFLVVLAFVLGFICSFGLAL